MARTVLSSPVRKTVVEVNGSYREAWTYAGITFYCQADAFYYWKTGKLKQGK